MNERIKLIRKSLLLSQSVFAQKIGIAQQMLYSLESSRRKIKDRHIKLICLTFNVNEEWLREGTGEMFSASAASENTEDFIQDLNTLPLTAQDKLIITKYAKMDSKQKEIFNRFVLEFVYPFKTE